MRRLAKDCAFTDHLAPIFLRDRHSASILRQHMIENPEQFDAFRCRKIGYKRMARNSTWLPPSQSFFSFESDVTLPQTPCELKVMLAHIVLNYDVRLEDVRLENQGV